MRIAGRMAATTRRVSEKIDYTESFGNIIDAGKLFFHRRSSRRARCP